MNCLYCPYHALNDYFERRTVTLPRGMEFCLGRTTQPTPPPLVASGTSATRKAMSQQSFKKLIAWFKFPHDATYTSSPRGIGHFCQA